MSDPFHSVAQPDLFGDNALPAQCLPAHQRLGTHALLLRGRALADADALLASVRDLCAIAPPTRLYTPGGRRMSVATTRCGDWGWVSDEDGTRYSRHNPATGQSWPALPPLWRQLATELAAEAGFDGFVPDTALVNRYEPGARLSLHQDKDERRNGQPIVSLSFGLPAVFLWGGAERSDRAERVPLFHGDVLVWGGVDRLRFHGVMPVAEGAHRATGACRINVTLRRAH